MIHVVPAEEPATFNVQVRQPGLAAIGELVSGAPVVPRRGPKREKIANRREEIPPDKFPPFWRECLDDMLLSYGRICAYLSLYIEPATGSPSVDHIIPKSKSWKLVYEWSNYRLACALMNSRKGSTDAVLDPFDVEENWFALEFVEYQVKPGEGAKGVNIDRVVETITKLGLNDIECCKARQEYVKEYLGMDPIPLSYLERRAPFVAKELRRQGLLRNGDA